jgi:hypothetical protein
MILGFVLCIIAFFGWLGVEFIDWAAYQLRMTSGTKLFKAVILGFLFWIAVLILILNL